MFKKLVSKVVRDPNKKVLADLRPLVEQVGELALEAQSLSDEALKERTSSFRERYSAGETLEEILPEAFALVREASVRTTGLRHYDVQIMGGILLHRGEVVEMRTGEGKTLVATLPLYLNALTGKSVHLVTVNEYLARRDGGWMGAIFHLLGLTVGCIGPQQFSALYDSDYVNPGAELEDERLVHWRPCTRQQAYKADVTYGISSEFGFDYLRDNMATSQEKLVQPKLHFAVIDEVDNVLIDEARTPLIISGPAPQSGKEYARFAGYVRRLRINTADEEEEPNGHYELDEKSRSISLTELGIAEIERRIPEIDADAGDSLYDPRFYQLTYYVDNALRAQYMFKRDNQYVVQNGEVVIVDDFTGRLMPGRRYSDGLHEAIEAKEGVNIKRETVTVATITLQNYFRIYEKLAGMTGTALTDAEEFDKIYELGVTPLPTNVQYIVDSGEAGLVERREKVENSDAISYHDPDSGEPVFFKRLDFADQVYGTEEAKDHAILAEVKRVRAEERPILVGTTSVEHSETIHRMLQKEKIQHTVLNAKMHQSEALVVAQAGRAGAVTISTNMAGRGTDILLGGNPEGMAAEALEKELFDRPTLSQLAYRMLTEGTDEARSFAQKHGRLQVDLVDWLEETKSEFDTALDEIQEIQVIGYLARTLQKPFDIDYNQILNVLRLVQGGAIGEARAFLDRIGRDTALADEAVRMWDLYSRYQLVQNDDRKLSQFLADTIFEKHYNARAALIRAVLAGELDAAKELVEGIPGLPSEMIQRIQLILEDTRTERQKVWQKGGLHVVGSERHESRRIDNQLRGRAARQGDPGSSRFFLSLEDDLMRRFGGERLKGFMSRTRIPEDMPIESGMLDRIIESSQERIEGYNFDMRKNVVEYDDVMNRQRQLIYDERKAILLDQATDLDSKVEEAFASSIADLVDNYIDGYRAYMQGEVEAAIHAFSTEATDSLNINGVLARLRGLLPGVLKLDRSELLESSPDQLADELMQLVYENEESGSNYYQLLQAMGRFLPLLPPAPNLASLASRRSGQLQARENLRRQYIAHVESFFGSFLSEHIEQGERDEIWREASDKLEQSFAQFSLDGLTTKTAPARQLRFKKATDSALSDLLLDSLSALESEQLGTALNAYVRGEQRRWREAIGEEEYHNFQRLLLLDAIDREWRDYLTAMDDLRREIGLASMGQRDPKVEYKRRSFEMFADMRNNIDKDIVNRYFRQIATHQAYIQQQEAAVAYNLQAQDAGYQVVRRKKGKGVELRRDAPKVGRNELCPCGSGKKYKHCHGKLDSAGGSEAANGRPVRKPGPARSRRASRNKRRRRRR
jgi:preprotein translocase subunit SecA